MADTSITLPDVELVEHAAKLGAVALLAYGISRSIDQRSTLSAGHGL